MSGGVGKSHPRVFIATVCLYLGRGPLITPNCHLRRQASVYTGMEHQCLVHKRSVIDGVYNR